MGSLNGVFNTYTTMYMKLFRFPERDRNREEADEYKRRRKYELRTRVVAGPNSVITHYKRPRTLEWREPLTLMSEQKIPTQHTCVVWMKVRSHPLPLRDILALCLRLH